MTPYYERGGITIYHGDCREVLPLLDPVDVIITDPVWPNAHPDLVGAEDPLGLFTEAAALFQARRLLVWLGGQSDPRFLSAVPTVLPFLRASYLSRAVPGYNGRCLVTGDFLYAYGEWPSSREGARVIPGECRVTSVPSRKQPHPAARNEIHAKWVVNWWSAFGETILDPFMGVGTTARAAADMGRRFIGIELEERYCEVATNRLRQEVMAL